MQVCCRLYAILNHVIHFQEIDSEYYVKTHHEKQLPMDGRFNILSMISQSTSYKRYYPSNKHSSALGSQSPHRESLQKYYALNPRTFRSFKLYK